MLDGRRSSRIWCGLGDLILIDVFKLKIKCCSFLVHSFEKLPGVRELHLEAAFEKEFSKEIDWVCRSMLDEFDESLGDEGHHVIVQVLPS